jgi:hypothetical protein
VKSHTSNKVWSNEELSLQNRNISIKRNLLCVIFLPTMALLLIVLVPALLIAIFLAQVYDRKQKSGRKPWSKCGADTLCSYIMFFRVGPWAADAYPGVILLNDESVIWGTMERMVKQKMEEQSLDHAGGSLTTLGYNYDLVLLGILRSRAKLSPFGYVFIDESLRQKMEQRLKLVKFVESHPHIESIPVKKPIFITGLVRTGTTLLHDLLGLHSEGRSHKLWEQLVGVPESSDESLDGRKADRARRRSAKKVDYDFGMSLIGLENFHCIHRVGYDLPEGAIFAY